MCALPLPPLDLPAGTLSRKPVRNLQLREQRTEAEPNSDCRSMRLKRLPRKRLPPRKKKPNILLFLRSALKRLFFLLALVVVRVCPALMGRVLPCSRLALSLVSALFDASISISMFDMTLVTSSKDADAPASYADLRFPEPSFFHSIVIRSGVRPESSMTECGRVGPGELEVELTMEFRERRLLSSTSSFPGFL